MTGSCFNCWHRVRVAVAEYTSRPTDRCWRWERLERDWPSGAILTADCALWRPMSEDETREREAYFKQSYAQWQAAQRRALEVTVL